MFFQMLESPILMMTDASLDSKRVYQPPPEPHRFCLRSNKAVLSFLSAEFNPDTFKNAIQAYL